MLYSATATAVYSRYIACCLGVMTSAHKPMTSSLFVCSKFKPSAEFCGFLASISTSFV